MKVITAKFQSTCPKCAKVCKQGSKVNWEPGQKVEHINCEAEAIAVQNHENAVAGSRATDSVISIPAPEGKTYLPFQKAGIAYAIAENNRKGTLFADEMGLGKTVQAIGVINADPSIKKVLVVCPASLKRNWKNELESWLARDLVVGIFPDRGEVTIINYDILAKLKVPTAKEPFAGSEFDLVIFDEGHYLKNPKTKRAKEVRRIAKACARVLVLSGTPIANRPIELWPILQLVDPHTWDPAGRMKVEGKYVNVGAGEGAGFWNYATRYCDAHKEQVSRDKSVWIMTGASNLSELQDKLRGSCMVRRLKSEVLKELPAKRRQVIVLPNADCDDNGYTINPDTYETDIAALRSNKTLFAEISVKRHEQAVRKAPFVLEHLLGALEESDGKIVVFGHHHDVIDILVQGLKEAGIGTVSVTGETPLSVRNQAVESFQNDPAIRVFVGSIGAAGVGLTLTASSHVIFAELDWVPGNVSQAEDRVHRIGQKGYVLIQHIVWDNTLDARICKILVAKQAVLFDALDKVPEKTIEELIEKSSIGPKALKEELADTSFEYGYNVRPKEPKDETPAGAIIDDAEREGIHEALRYLAEACDGAQAKDGQGFNRLDATFGKSLARATKLSQKQAMAGKKMLVKYAGQLGRLAK